MKYNPDKHHRRSIRLKGYDYTQAGTYFITLCTIERMCLFGSIQHGMLQLNEFGKIVAEEWQRTSQLRSDVACGASIVMPNHFHGILIIKDRTRSPTLSENQSNPIQGPAADSVGAIIRAFKAASTRRINLIRNEPGAPVWQRNYYEHIIRGEEAYDRIAAYINTNPQRWIDDEFNS